MKNARRSIALIILVVMIVSMLSGCKDSAVKEVEEAISSIGTVTIDSEDAIEKAEQLLFDLSDSQKNEVKNYYTLVNARETYDALVKAAVKTKDELCEIATEVKADELLNDINGNKARANSYIGSTYAITGHVIEVYEDHILLAGADTGDWCDTIHSDDWYAFAVEVMFRVYLPTEDLLKINPCDNIIIVGEISGTETIEYHAIKPLVLDMDVAYLVSLDADYEGRFRL